MGNVGATALVLLCLGITVWAKAPCLDGRKGVTRAEILRDDWACFTYCSGASSTWNSTCKLCCPTWLGGEGNSLSGGGGSGATTTRTSTASTATSGEGSTEATTEPGGATTESEAASAATEAK